MTHSKRQVLILDCEASGLGDESYPISIGICGHETQPWYWMISPMEGWDYWDDVAETIHGIEKEYLHEYGRDAFLVARDMNALFRGMTLYCDSPWDEFWIKKLFEDCGVLMSFSLVWLQKTLTEKECEAYSQWVESAPMTHHPVDDARRIRDYLVSNSLLPRA